MPEEQRRRFARIRFSSGARFTVGEATRDCEVVDLSMKGALIALAAGEATPVGAACRLDLDLGGAGATISMAGRIAHAGPGRIGVMWDEIDLDSITHLRRLIELNLGDADLLGRELHALLAE